MMSGMSITDARKQVFDYGNPYYSSNLTIATSSTDDSIKSWKDLKGKTLGAKTVLPLSIILMITQKNTVIL